MAVLTLCRKAVFADYTTRLRDICRDLDHGSDASSDTQRKDGSSIAQPLSSKDHPIFRVGQQILGVAYKLINDQEQRDIRFKELKLELSLGFKHDEAGFKELLRFGREHGEKIAECIILPQSDAAQLETDASRTTGTEEMAVDLFRKSRRIFDQGTWGETAQAQLKCWSSLAKTLPQGTEGVPNRDN